MQIEDKTVNLKNRGQTIIDDVKSMRNSEDWNNYWNENKKAFPFGFGDCWKHMVEYVVDDVASEVAFFIEVMGLTPMSVGDEYCMFTSPTEDFHFSFVPAGGGKVTTPPDSIRIEFTVDNILEVADRFERRGIVFEEPPRPNHIGNPNLFHGHFRTPNGIIVELWGMTNKENKDE